MVDYLGVYGDGLGIEIFVTGERYLSSVDQFIFQFVEGAYSTVEGCVGGCPNYERPHVLTVLFAYGYLE